RPVRSEHLFRVGDERFALLAALERLEAARADVTEARVGEAVLAGDLVELEQRLGRMLAPQEQLAKARALAELAHVRRLLAAQREDGWERLLFLRADAGAPAQVPLLELGAGDLEERLVDALLVAEREEDPRQRVRPGLGGEAAH